MSRRILATSEFVFRSLFPSNDHIHLQYIFCFCLTQNSLLFVVSFSGRIAQFTFRTWLQFLASDIFFINTITEHAHNIYRMSSHLRSIAYDLHYCLGSKHHRRQNKMTFSPELYTSLPSKSEWFTFFIYLIFTYIRNLQKTENNDFGISYYFNGSGILHVYIFLQPAINKGVLDSFYILCFPQNFL